MNPARFLPLPSSYRIPWLVLRVFLFSTTGLGLDCIPWPRFVSPSPTYQMMDDGDSPRIYPRILTARQWDPTGYPAALLVDYSTTLSTLQLVSYSCTTPHFATLHISTLVSRSLPCLTGLFLQHGPRHCTRHVSGQQTQDPVPHPIRTRSRSYPVPWTGDFLSECLWLLSDFLEAKVESVCNVCMYVLVTGPKRLYCAILYILP